MGCPGLSREYELFYYNRRQGLCVVLSAVGCCAKTSISMQTIKVAKYNG